MTAPAHPCLIVPPFVFEHVIRSGDADDREAALASLSVDHGIRGVRIEGRHRAPAARLAPGTEAAGLPDRVVYDAGHRQDLHARRVLRTEGQAPVPDLSADQAFDGLGDTYTFYWETYRRDSIDDAGLPLLGEVHFGTGYDNAFWDGERMVFGDGDGRLFTGFTGAVDVIGHELTHGVTERTLGLRYMGQSGALNESISDVFGSLVKQHGLGQDAAAADWLIGEGILGPALHGQALRSMRAPGTAFSGDRQPAHMRDYVRTLEDDGGVHINSGIPNRAFYLAATRIGGPAWEGAGRAWYEVLRERMVGPDCQFHAFAAATVRAAGRLFGAGAREVEAVRSAWTEVGVS